ncbi:hypothetical protein BS78_K317600 [Paspalum vaginatum]|uniref:Uncharacterized protein n=1 Tax=Paspalum vaginatum TaxID=158149 RepID=A0A9W7X7Q2_9POAL|nr:hypothetical protein BS78_K317600 [Paspalum vaginatum]
MYPSAPPDAYNKFSSGASANGAATGIVRPAAGGEHEPFTPRRRRAEEMVHRPFPLHGRPGELPHHMHMPPASRLGRSLTSSDKGSCSCIASGADLWAHLHLDVDGVHVLVRLPVEAEGRVRPGRGGVPGLPGTLLLRAPGLVPEYRELKNRGFDLGIGWEANMERQRRGVAGGAVMGAPAHAARHDEIDDGCESCGAFAFMVLLCYGYVLYGLGSFSLRLDSGEHCMFSVGCDCVSVSGASKICDVLCFVDFM